MIDPSEIETRFALEDGMAFMASIFEEPSEESKRRIEQVVRILDDLPPREADFIDLYYFRRLKQTDIAHIFGVSQPTVCYRLQRAAARIQFLLRMPAVDLGRLEKELRNLLVNPTVERPALDVKIMLLMLETTCQSEVAKRLGVSQGLVRHRFIRSLSRMREALGDRGSYVRLFEFVAGNLNILREVQRPAWDAKVTHTID